MQETGGFTVGIIGGASAIAGTGFDVTGFVGAEFGANITDFRRLDAVATFSHPWQTAGIEADWDVGFAFIPATFREFKNLVITDINIPTTPISIKVIYNPARPGHLGLGVGLGPGVGGSVVFGSRSTQ